MENSAKSFVVFTCTFYQSVDDARCQCCLDFLRKLCSSSIWVVVVDASPATSGVREAMQAVGGPTAVICKQQVAGKKGAALREAISICLKLPGVEHNTWLSWQEPEKVNMAQLWRCVFDQVSATGESSDVVIPFRDCTIFQATYPIEQYHSESYGNLWLDCAAKSLFPKGTSTNVPLPPLDWHFGPFAFRSQHSHFWMSHGGELWDAQVVPIVHAARRGLSIKSVVVPFHAPAIMKTEEEGNLGFIEKRIMQINFLDPKVKAAWVENFDEYELHKV